MKKPSPKQIVHKKNKKLAKKIFRKLFPDERREDGWGWENKEATHLIDEDAANLFKYDQA